MKASDKRKWVSKIIMILAGVLLLGAFIAPLWRITLEAPQYLKPLGMDIWVNKIVDTNPNDIKNINIMNHYVGMNKIPEHLKEFEIFPPVILIMAFLAVVIGFIGNKKLFIAWFVLIAFLGIGGMYDFYLWEYDYGHSLDPKAAIKFTDEDGEPLAYQPPMFGRKKILNFVATALPQTGAYFIFLAMAMSLVAFFLPLKIKVLSKEKVISLKS